MAVIRLPDKIFKGDFSDVVAPVSGDNGKAFVWNQTAQRAEWVGVAASPGGSTTQVQYNNAGAFAGHSGFVYDGAGKVTLSAALVVPVWKPALDSTAALQLRTASDNTIVALDTTNKKIILYTGYFSERIETGTVDLVAGGRGLKWYNYAGNQYATLTTNNSGTFEYRHSSGAVVNFPQSASSALQAQSYEFLSSSVYSPGFATDKTSGHEAGIHGASGGVHLVTDRTSRVVILQNGNVGIQQASPTAFLHLPASTTSYATMRIPSGTAPTSPNSGDLWYDGTNLKFRDGTTTRTLTWT